MASWRILLLLISLALLRLCTPATVEQTIEWARKLNSTASLAGGLQYSQSLTSLATAQDLLDAEHQMDYVGPDSTLEPGWEELRYLTFGYNGVRDSIFTVVFVHGSYHKPAHYVPVMKALKGLHIEAYCPILPTCNITDADIYDSDNKAFNSEPPPEGWPTGSDDVKEIQKLLDDLILTQRKRVLLVGHSYGGWVAQQALKPAYSRRSMSASGSEGGLVGIVYMAAFVVPLGYTVKSFFEFKFFKLPPPPFVRSHPYGLVTPYQPEEYFFNDLNRTLAIEWSSLLTAQPVPDEKMTNALYKRYPSAYLACTKDKALPPAVQLYIRLRSGWGGLKFSVVWEIVAGHSPMVSNPLTIAFRILEFYGKAEAAGVAPQKP